MPASQIAPRRPPPLEEEEEAEKQEGRPEPEIWLRRPWTVVWTPCVEASSVDPAGENKEWVSEEMIRGGSIERSFKNKDTAKVRALLLAPILLVQKSACAGEAGVGEVAVAVGTCKGSLDRRWGCSGKTLRRSSQFSASTRMECSNGEFSRVLR